MFDNICIFYDIMIMCINLIKRDVIGGVQCKQIGG